MVAQAAGVERIGLEAYLGLADFNKNLSAYTKSLQDVVQKTEGAAQSSKTAGAAITGKGGLGGALGSLVPMLGGAGGALVSMLAPLAAVGAGFFALGKAMVETQEMITEAMPMEGVQKAFYAIAASAGSTGEAVLESFQKASGGMVGELELMQRFNKAAQLVSKDFALGLPEAIGYLGKISAATGDSMDYLLNSLIVGVGRLSQPILDNLNITLSLEDAYKAWADENGRTAESMSKTEQQAAVLAVVLGKLRDNTAALANPTEMASGAVAALSAEFGNVRRDIGALFLPALQAGATALRSMILSIRDAIDVGGSWRAGIVELGASINVIVRLFGGLALGIVNSLVGPLGSGFSSLMEFLGKVAIAATKWGINIIAGLAQGMVAAMSTVLIPVFTTLAQIMAYWMAPGSPPRFAPDLYDWGTAAMGEFIRGMTDADFGALNAIQKPLQEVLDLFAAQGKMEKGDIGPAYVSISKRIIADLQGTGKVTEETLAALRETTGEYAEDVVALVLAELDLAEATAQVERAEKALDDARKRRTETQEALGEAVREYNRLLRAGAPTEKLAGQFAAIRAAEKNVALAKEQEQSAEANVETEKEGLDALEESVQVRRAALDEMLEMARSLIPVMDSAVKQAVALKDALAGAGEPGEILVPAPVIPPVDFGTTFEGLTVEIGKRTREIEDEVWWSIQRLTRFGGPLDHLKAQMQLVGYIWQFEMEKVQTQTDMNADPTIVKLNELMAALGVLWSGPTMVEGETAIDRTSRALQALATILDILAPKLDPKGALGVADAASDFRTLDTRIQGVSKAVNDVGDFFLLAAKDLAAMMGTVNVAIDTSLQWLEDKFIAIKAAIDGALKSLRDLLGLPTEIEPPVIILPYGTPPGGVTPGEEEEEEVKPGKPRSKKGISRIATGTQSFTGGLALVGELGPELVRLPRGAQVFTAAETARMRRQDYTHPDRTLATYSPGQGQPSNVVNLTFGDVRIANDMDWLSFKAGVHKAVMEGIA